MHHRVYDPWVLLIAAIAVIASVGCGGPIPYIGTEHVEVTEEAGLIAFEDFEGDWYYVSSPDGGLTWTSEFTEWETYLEPNLDVYTPRGQYILEGPDIVRVGPENERVTVYSTAYLQQPGNMWFQNEDTAQFGHRVLASEPRSIAHDPATGNVVAAMGLQGVVVGTPDEQWQRASVGPYTPTDFSFASKSTRLLFNLPFWLASIALTLSMLGLSLFFSQLSERRTRISLRIFISTLIGASILIFLAIQLNGQFPYFSLFVVLFLVASPVILVIVAMILTGTEPSSALSRLITAALLGVPCLGLAVGAIVLFSLTGGSLIAVSLLAVIASLVVYVLVGLMLLVSGQDLVGYGTIPRFFAATNGLVLLTFMVWLHTGIQTWIAVALAVTLTAGAAIIYSVWLRSKNRPDDDQPIDRMPRDQWRPRLRSAPTSQPGSGLTEELL